MMILIIITIIIIRDKGQQDKGDEHGRKRRA